MKRPRLSLPYSVLTEKDTVRLIAGEDFRYTLRGAGLDEWLPGLLAALDGRRTVDEVVGGWDEERRKAAREVVERLAGERVLIEGEPRVEAAPYGLRVEGRGPLREALKDRDGAKTVSVLVQDRLDFAEALAWNARRSGPTLWVTHGPLTRAYVSPVFLRDAGPCLACLLRHFERLSPAPEIHAALRLGASEIVAAPFPDAGVAILAQLALWKVGLLARAETPSAVFKLHVLEAESLEVSTHRVLLDPECHEH